VLDWDLPLSHRVGSAVNLDGIDVYYDFDWSGLIGHNRSQFTNGQCLARVARAHCPAGKTPALVLTTKDVQPHPVETDSYFFFIVNMPEALAATGNAAETLYARYLESEITKYAQIKELASNPEMIDAVLSVERVAGWLQEDPERRAQLDDAIGATREVAEREIDLETLVRALRSLMETDLDAEVLAQIADAFGPAVDRDRRVAVLRAMTQDVDGRYVTGEVFVERTADRIADARSAMAAYQARLDDPNSGETAMQAFIEENLWLLGLDYARMMPQRRVMTGRLDFILERYDGFQDLLELKSPQDPIIVVSTTPADGSAPPPSAYSLSPALAQVLGQVHSYRDLLTRYPEAAEELYGLRHSRDPRIVIVIGRADRLPEHSQRVLTELNKSLHRVEVVPYDVLARRAEAVLSNVEQYLLVGDAVSVGDEPEAAERTRSNEWLETEEDG
jgi:Shedu protein SduA, C-terminal